MVRRIRSVGSHSALTTSTHRFCLPLLWVTFVLYGLSSTLLSYIVSTFAGSPLAAWAICAAVQALMFAAYFGAHLGVVVTLKAATLTSNLNAINFTFGLFSPVANLTHAIFIGIGLFGLTCGNPRPWSIAMYGGSIMYLSLQCLAFFGIILWLESDRTILAFVNRKKQAIPEDSEKSVAIETKEMAENLACVQSATSGLRVSHLSKSFGKHSVVEDVSFNVQVGEIFALLGPNGAGKSELSQWSD